MTKAQKQKFMKKWFANPDDPILLESFDRVNKLWEGEKMWSKYDKKKENLFQAQVMSVYYK